ncbi:hypothetical protein PAMA_002914 [Pampus argenteus]
MASSSSLKEGKQTSTSKNVMEKDKPWALIIEGGARQAFLDNISEVEEHFHIITCREFLQNPLLHGPKIQVMFTWSCTTVAADMLFRFLPSLKVVTNGGAGVEHLDVPFITSQGVKVTNTPGVVSDSTADIAMGLLLASARRIVEGHQIAVAPKTTQLPQHLMGADITGSTLGIIGMGEIGYRIAQRSKGFDMKIIYHNRKRRSVEDELAVGATYCESLDYLLRKSDFVMVAASLSPETTGLISHRQLSQMKPTAILINISRGLLVDQDALVKALQSGTIRAAAMDVTHPEPLPREHPLLGLPNVLITPHFGMNTCATVKGILRKMVENAQAVVRGLPIPNEVKLK